MLETSEAPVLCVCSRTSFVIQSTSMTALIHKTFDPGISGSNKDEVLAAEVFQFANLAHKTGMPSTLLSPKCIVDRW